MKNEIEKVASGLRNMAYPPQYFLFVDCYENRYYDERSICNIPVLRIGNNSATSSEMDTYDCPWIPVYETDNQSHVVNSSYFYKGYSNL